MMQSVTGRRMRRMRRVVVVALSFGIAALVVAACGSSSSSTSQQSGAAAAAVSNATAAKKGPAVHGKPITIGMIDDLNAPDGNFVNLTDTLKAAVQYINVEAGGAGGRPLAVDTCNSQGTPAGAVQCANQLASAKVDAVAYGVNLGGVQANQVLFNAGIPVVGGLPLDAGTAKSKMAFFFWPGAVAGFFFPEAKYLASEKGYKTWVVESANNPIGQLLNGLYAKYLKGLGATSVHEFTHPQNTTDFSSLAAAIMALKPQGVIVDDPPPNCLNVAKAMVSLGLGKTSILSFSNCELPVYVKAFPQSVLAQTYFDSPTLPITDTSNADVQIVRHAMATYGAAQYINDPTAGFMMQSAMDIKAIADEIVKAGGTVDSATLVAALRSTNGHTNFLGYPFSCTGTAVPGYPAICSAYERVDQWKNNALTDVSPSWYSPTAAVPDSQVPAGNTTISLK